MKRLALRVFTGLLALSSVLFIAVGCSSTTQPTSSTLADIKATADPVMENILVSLNSDNYAGFSRDFSSTTANTLNQAAFDKLYNQMQTAIGNYQSKVYVSDATQSGFTTVAYVARYSKEPAGVTVTLVIQPLNGVYKVQGLNFDSPNLRGQPIDIVKLRVYADPETENILVSLKNNDYAGFAQDLDQVMKNAISQTAFGTLYNQIKSTVGDYQSKEFESASMQNNIITVAYLARYTAEAGGVWVNISFDSDQKIAGLHFNSPKLRAQSK